MVDMTKTISAKSDQTNSDDLIGRELTIKVTKVSILGGDQPVAIHYEGDNGKPYKPCKSMRRVMVQVWGSDGAEYVGKSMTLFRDPSVVWAGTPVGGIRISHMSHIDKPVMMALTVSKGSRKPYTVKPLVIQQQQQAEIDPELLAFGEANAALGVEAYKAWVDGLSKEQRAAIKPHHATWIKVAKERQEQKQEDPPQE